MRGLEVQCHVKTIDDAQLAGEARERGLKSGLIENSRAQLGDQVAA